MADPRVRQVPVGANARTVAEKAENAAEEAAARVYATEKNTAVPRPSMLSWRPTTAGTSSTLNTLFKLSLGGFVIFLILVFVHYVIHPVFSFMPGDNGIIPIPTASDKQAAFLKSPAGYDVSANFIQPLPCEYTIGLDLFSTGTFPLTTIPRVLLYRNSTTSVPMTQTDTSGTLLNRFTTSNLVLWMDPVKNDLYLTIFTQTVGKDNVPSGSAAAEQFGPIENVSLRKPVRISIVFSSSFIELYMNGKLQISGALKSPPRTVPATSYFYPPVQQIGNNVMIANLAYWPRHLTAAEILNFESAPVATTTFFTEPAKK